jgi:hypothetical protein
MARIAIVTHVVHPHDGQGRLATPLRIEARSA